MSLHAYHGRHSVVPFLYPNAPIAPQPYTIPGGSVSVNNGAELATELGGGSQKVIVCQNGSYDAGAGAHFPNNLGHRIYAATLGGANFTSGISIAAGDGARIQGPRFTITDPNKTLLNVAIHIWDQADPTNVSLLDLDFDSSGQIGHAVWNVATSGLEGFVAQRVKIRNFTDTGMRLSNHFKAEDDRLTTPMLVTDLDIAGIKRSTPGSAGGTAEAGLWAGEYGVYKRMKILDCGWMCVWTGGVCSDSLFEHLDLDDAKTDSTENGSVGIYFEHKTKRCRFRYVRMGYYSDLLLGGVVSEWPAGKPTAAGIDNIIEYSWIKSRRYGIFLDQGTQSTTIRYTKFVGQCWAAIGDNLPGALPNVYNNQGNDYSEIEVGASAVITNVNKNTSTCSPLP